MASPQTKKKRHSHQRTSSSFRRTEVIINVYDLLPQGTVSSVLWFLGSSLLHTGLVIKDREYAYGGHDRPGVSGVYWTKPLIEPPGGTFRCELVQGLTFRSPDEIEGIIREVSQKFLGTSYNLLTNNCNHFTSYVCQQLTGTPAPAWLNRAATVGKILPCLVPRDWVDAPDYDGANGELLEDIDENEEEEGPEDDERVAMLHGNKMRASQSRSDNLLDEDDDWNSNRIRRSGENTRGRVSFQDTDGRKLPASERAPPGRNDL